MISEERAEKAVEYIRDNAEVLALARSQVKYLDHKRKVIRATGFAEAAGTVAERECFAERHADYKKCIEDYRDAVYEAELTATKMKAAELTIDIWRSQNSSKNRGHV